ncbi:MAG: hypothetical protein KAY59_02325 [Acidobacteria bacterium]|nr:hypothetical protein [Acidobacteriota bacterium]
MTDHTERQLLATERPELPGELRERVLAAATPLVHADNSTLDRIWFSPRWRISAAIAFVTLAGAEAVSSGGAAPTASVQNRPAGTPARTVAIVAAELGLSPDETASLVAQVRTSGSQIEGVNR